MLSIACIHILFIACSRRPLQSDLVGFTKLGSEIPAEDLLAMLHELFTVRGDLLSHPLLSAASFNLVIYLLVLHPNFTPVNYGSWQLFDSAAAELRVTKIETIGPLRPSFLIVGLLSSRALDPACAIMRSCDAE